MQDIASACVKCAKCIQSCTTYQIHRDEVHSPRGFLELIKSADLDASASFFDTCFLCTHCVSACPIGLPIDFAIMQTRSREKKSLLQYFYFFLLKHPRLMDVIFSFLALIPSCAFKQKKVGVIFKLPFFGQSFLKKYKKKQKIEEKYSRKVAVFAGCLINYNYPHTGESLLKIMEFLQIGVVLPQQMCCSAPALFSGDFQTSVFLIKKNIEYFEKIIDKVEAVLIPEATCAAVMIKDWERVLGFCGEESYKKRLQKISPKFIMTSDFLTRHTDLMHHLKQAKKQEILVTYHDPCHACKVLKIKNEPREFLSTNYAFRELEDSESCCGFGGISMQTKNYKIAQEVGERKISKILQTQASVVSAECSACRAQIGTLLKEHQEEVIFAHPLELIAQSLETLDKNAGEIRN